MDRFPGYDAWKLDTPPEYDIVLPRCENCNGEVDDEDGLNEDGFCRDCLPYCKDCDTLVFGSDLNKEGLCIDCRGSCEDCGTIVDDESDLNEDGFCEKCVLLLIAEIEKE